MAPRLQLISKLSLVWPPQTSWEVSMGTKGEKTGASAMGLEAPPPHPTEAVLLHLGGVN